MVGVQWRPPYGADGPDYNICRRGILEWLPTVITLDKAGSTTIRDEIVEMG